ncbi:MAG: nucleotidyltransferase family protein [Janthinobacterium lividum]
MNGRHEIEQRREQIAEICREHGVARLLVFGSVLRDDFNPETSDIDFLVEFLPSTGGVSLDAFLQLRVALQDLMNRQIDLGQESALKNPYLLHHVNLEKELLYAA